MKCLETRQTPEGFKRRRYESAAKVRHTTIEVPIEIWRRVNTVGSQQDRATQVQRTLDRDSQQRQAVSLCATGKSMRATARAMQLPEATVRRWVTKGLAK